MKRDLSYLPIISVLMLTSCHNDPKKVSYRNFIQTINHYYAERCSLLVGIPSSEGDHFPITVDMPDDDALSKGILVQKDAEDRLSELGKWDSLVDAGLLSAENKRAIKSGITGDAKEVQQRIYSLTVEGESALDHGTFFCVGHNKVAQIKKFTPAQKVAGGPVMTTVTFTLAPIEMPEWTKKDSVQTAWPELEHAIANDQEKEMTLVKTEKGWVTAEDFYENGNG